MQHFMMDIDHYVSQADAVWIHAQDKTNIIIIVLNE